ncbi:hypothetical protein [Streptomyces sp. DSM 40907]|uniref:hypothetical protein n=1 Tax=Streptomyces kutzneri TaxID=3051179 RepID=UPI0028D3F719|nr:hypothetical protein [Streptomyces sp. DSM 40907]
MHDLTTDRPSDPAGRCRGRLHATATTTTTTTASARARTPNADDAAATASSRTPASLTYKGFNFDTDREVWRTEYVRREIAAVKEQLHGNAVLLLGHRLDRLTEAASIAAAHGLFVWFEPRQFDQDADQTLAFLGSVARAAESLRTRYPGVGLSVGTELTIFMSGLCRERTTRSAVRRWGARSRPTTRSG